MAAILFNEVQPGILAIQNVIDIGWALCPEAILDFSVPTQNCDLIKATLKIPPMTDAVFRKLFDHFVQNDPNVSINVPQKPFGPATEIMSMDHRLIEEDLLQTPYRFGVNLFGDANRQLRELVGAEQWIENEGTLPITNSLLYGLSTPEFTMFGVGAMGTLSRPRHKLGYVHCVLKGRQTFTVVPKGMTSSRMRSYLRSSLQGTPFSQETLRCINFLQHSNLYYNEDFLQQRYNAKSVVLNAGECAYFQSGVDFEVRTDEPTLAVTFSCVTRTWLNAENVGECEHVAGSLTTEQLNNVRENARMIKNYAARLLFLNANGPVRAMINVRHRNYPQRVDRIHSIMGVNRQGSRRRGGIKRNANGNSRHGNSGENNEPDTSVVAVPGPQQ